MGEEETDQRLKLGRATLGQVFIKVVICAYWLFFFLKDPSGDEAVSTAL